MKGIGFVLAVLVLLSFGVEAREEGDIIWSYFAQNDPWDWHHIRSIKNIPDVDGDTHEDVVAVSENDTLYCFSGETGNVIWRFVADPCFLQRGLISVPDLDGDGISDVVLGTIWGTRAVFAISGDSGETIWEYDTHIDAGGGWVYEVGPMGDITGDGIVEILAGAGMYASRAYLFNGTTGEKIWEHYLGMNAAVFGIREVGDLNGDSTPDVVITTGDTESGTNRVIALNGDDGSEIWNVGLACTGWTVVPIGDIDSDGAPDIAVGTGDGKVVGYSGASGMPLWTTSLGGAGIQITDLGILPDIDGNGFPELLPSGTGMNTFCCIDALAGDIIWSTPAVDQVFTSNAIPDISGDGVWDVAGGTGYINCRFYAIDGLTGDTLWQKDMSDNVESTWWIEDIDDNGYPDILAGLHDGWIYALSDGYVAERTPCILTAEIGGDADYRSFWVNGSWDDAGEYDDMWTAPMLQLKNDGVLPDTSTDDEIFTGVVELKMDSTHFYRWWTGSEDDPGSFLADGDSFRVLSSDTVAVPTLFVDPSGGGFNEWVICLAGDMNGWNDSADNLTRDYTEWSGMIELAAGNYEYKYTVMHSWSATYGYDESNPGIAAIPGSNIPFNAPSDGEYMFFFEDMDNSYGVYWRKDAALLSIESPPDTLTEISYIPKVTVENLGWTTEDFDVYCTIDGYVDTSEVDGLMPDSIEVVIFDEWTVPAVDTYTMEVVSRLPDDEVASNDTLRKTLTCLVGIGEHVNIPRRFFFSSASPNPTGGRVVINYGIPERSRVVIDVYSITGDRVRRLLDDVQNPGYGSVGWDLRDVNGGRLPSGVYFCRMLARDFIQTRKITVLR